MTAPRSPRYTAEVTLAADSDHRTGSVEVIVDGPRVTLALDVDLDDGIPGAPMVTDALEVDEPIALLELALACTRAAEFGLLTRDDATGADSDASGATKDLERAILRLLGRW